MLPPSTRFALPAAVWVTPAEGSGLVAVGRGRTGHGVADPVHAQGVGRAGDAGRASRPTMTTWSPGSQRPSVEQRRSTWQHHLVGVLDLGARKVSMPQVSASWVRTIGSGVKASSGIGER